MNYRYDYNIITGLNYSCVENPMFIIDVASVPKDFDLEKAIHLLRNQPLMMVDTKIEFNVIEDIGEPKITSNSIL